MILTSIVDSASSTTIKAVFLPPASVTTQTGMGSKAMTPSVYNCIVSSKPPAHGARRIKLLRFL